MVETIHIKRVNCTEPLAPCSNVLLFNTNLTNNWAKFSGSAILATTPYNVLVGCRTEIKHASSFFVSESILTEIYSKRAKRVDPKDLCSPWQGNSLSPNAPGDVIGTFGHHIVLTTVSNDGPQIVGDYRSGFMLPNVKSAKQFPIIVVKTLDAFNNTPAPTLFEKGALLLSSVDGFLKDPTTLSFKNMSCMISSINARVPKGNYTIRVTPMDEDVLEPTTLTISINDCGINEELTRDERSCQECCNGSYNFELSKIEGCTPCPKHATCDGIFVVSESGYWHKSPCHDKVTKCIVEKACNYPNRTEAIANFTQHYTDCDFNDTNLEEYGKIQCRKVSPSPY